MYEWLFFFEHSMMVLIVNTRVSFLLEAISGEKDLSMLPNAELHGGTKILSCSSLYIHPFENVPPTSIFCVNECICVYACLWRSEVSLQYCSLD